MAERFDIYNRTFLFAHRVVKMERILARDKRVNSKTLSQLLDAACSIGANLEEACGAQSKADFHAKLRISLKEARESHYWLRLLHASGTVSPKRLDPLIQEAHEIVAILTTIAKKVNPTNPAPPKPPSS